MMVTLMSEEAKDRMRKVALQLKAKSLASIRQALSLADDTAEPSMVLIYQVKALFREACISGDMEAARSHAKVLRYLTEQLPVDEDHRLLRVALWSDATSALLQLRRPLLEHSQWMPKMLSSMWRWAEYALPSSSLVPADLSDCVYDADLRAAFLHVRQALYVCKVSMIAQREEQVQRAEIIFHWMTSKAEYHICCLLNLYFDLMSPATEINRSLTAGERYTSAATALALLHILQKSFCDVTQSNGVDLHESAGILHPRLLRTTQLALKHSSEQERALFGAAHFWILFVGAYCEERESLTNWKTCPGRATDPAPIEDMTIGQAADMVPYGVIGEGRQGCS